jgi:hypothetical protein
MSVGARQPLRPLLADLQAALDTVAARADERMGEHASRVPPATDSLP